MLAPGDYIVVALQIVVQDLRDDVRNRHFLLTTVHRGNEVALLVVTPSPLDAPVFLGEAKNVTFLPVDVVQQGA